MESMNEYFPPEAEGDCWFDHPRLRHWQALQQRGAQLRLEVSREQYGLYVDSPVLHVTIEIGGQAQHEDEPWSEDLHRGLVELGVRAVSDDHERLRFGRALADALERVEDRGGIGFFNSVVIDTLKQGPLAERLAEQLRRIHVLPASHDSSDYAECRDFIVGVIRGRARELTRDLGYEQPRASQILCGALAIYLDDRFSVTARRQLGLA